MKHVEMCAGGDLMEKTVTEVAPLLQKISKAAAMRRDWETRLAEEPEYNSRKKKCAEFSKEATPEVTKEEPITEKLEEEHIKSRTTPSIDFAVPNCRMDLPGPTTSVGTRTDYSVGPWDYPACATRHLMAWSTRATEEKYSVRKLYMSCTVWKTPRRTRLVLSPYSDL
jgi:hypothetical protein